MIRSGGRPLRELLAAAGHGVDWAEAGAALSRAVSAAVPHDAIRLSGGEPGALCSFSFWHGYEPDFGQALLNACHTGEDPHRWAEFAAWPVPAVVVGVDRRHTAARRLFAGHGVGSELRMVLRDARGVWGTLGLLRSAGGRQFGEAEVAAAARLTPTLVAFLREYVTAVPLCPASPSPAPGVLVVGPDHRIRSATANAVDWQRCLSARHAAPPWTGKAFFAGLSAATRSGGSPLVVGPAASYGRWIACQAERLGDDVTVVIQAATAAQLLPSLCAWYGLTDRERQVVGQLREAAAAKQIARRLELSVHTVNDHLRAIFRKTGVHGRDELLTALSG
ncbi:helix-turn-helix domain-containing protein [Amycolatopsis albispora]|uniref:Helix-turn-helix transcriptional regulator n=1 Tax=Amycolatopsis albispora TaxID=1804986 RepID=A0A344KZF0_9PSEU|nr:helix-turn-helix transcriptional regulator [Amycolatopsis albispora]AXB41174.1 helix-turn-helix transcriptional regulator [Amycolatopsis albispora]